MSEFEDFAVWEARNHFEKFLVGLIEKKNTALVERYNKIHDRSLNAVLNAVKSLNQKMEKKYSNLVKTRDFLKDSRMNPKLESKLFKSINKIDIFSTPPFHLTLKAKRKKQRSTTSSQLDTTWKMSTKTIFRMQPCSISATCK